MKIYPNRLPLALALSLLACAGRAQLMVGGSEPLSLDTTTGPIVIESDWHQDRTFGLWLSTRWAGADAGVLTVNGVERAILSADEVRSYVLTFPAASAATYDCEWRIGEVVYRRTIVTTGFRKVAFGGELQLDTRKVRRASASGERIRYDVRWAEGAAKAAVSCNGEEIAQGTAGVVDWLPGQASCNNVLSLSLRDETGQEVASARATFISDASVARIDDEFPWTSGLFDGCANIREAVLDCDLAQLASSDGDSGATTLKDLFPDSFACLTNVILGVKVTALGANFFDGCAALKSVYFRCATAPATAAGTYAGAPDDLVSYVVKGTTGWDGDATSKALPQSWPAENGRAIAWWEPYPPMALVEGVSFTPSGEITVAAKGVKQIVKISGNGEAWTAVTSDDWLKLNSASGTATGKGIVCTVAENVDAEARVGYVYIAGRTLKVSQAGRGATVEEAVVADTAGGEVAVAVSVSDATTTWRASSACPWIRVETVGGTGSGEVWLQVLPWNRTTSRTGTVTIAGHVVTVTQEAATLELSATSAAVAAQGGGISVSVATAAGLEWTVADVPEWIVLDGEADRMGSDSVLFVVSPNATFENRTATLLVAGMAFTVTQEAARVEIEGGLVRSCNAAGIDSLVLTVRVDVATASWTAKISEEADGVWVFLMSDDASVEGDGTFELYVAAAGEGNALPRTAMVTVGNATLRIVQGDGVVVEGVDTPFVIPTSWFEKYYSTQGGTTPDEWQKIAEGSGLKTDASGAVLPVWHDYVAGTDPTDAASRFTASVALEDGKPVVSWSPALNGEGVREGVRTYRVWGKANLTDAAWSEVAPDGESGYRFFRVTVEMP